MTEEQELLERQRSGGVPPGEAERQQIRVSFVSATDDDEAVTDTFANRPGFAVTEIHDGADLEPLQIEELDCVVCDYQLSERDGLDVLEAVRREYPTLPFVLVAREPIDGLASEALAAGATDFVHLPPGECVDLLAHRIRTAVANVPTVSEENHPSEAEIHRIYRALNTSQEGISLVDADGEFIYVNDTYADLYAYDPAEMLGMHWENLYPADEIGRVYDDILPRVDDGGTWTGETTGLRADQTTFVEDHSLSKTASGGFVCSVRDITDERQTERQVAHERERLEFVNRIIRHNLFNGLNVVSARTEFLDGHVEPEMATHLETVQRRVEDMIDHVEMMRAYMNVVVDDEPEREAVALDDILGHELTKADDAYDEAVYEYADIPSVTVLADDLLSLVFENLLANAVQHNDTETPTIAVTVDTTPDDVAVHISDNGPGIGADVREAVFQRGEKGFDSPGSGFGLYLVQEFVTSWGGSVAVETGDNDGAHFVVTLPRA
ncbi:ATP-binding protein [Haloarchaeobius sp. DFWS5]|uniref:ATP-binding protein n=1 Tax=Haloarchaeobius sp. DFWS5 TaxID=3446114 RepID=UPI003EB9828E